MAAKTTQANGNWSAGGTWTGGVAPVAGDTVTISHAVSLDSDQIIGSSPATGGTAAVTIASGGSLTYPGAQKLTCRGDFITSSSNTVRSLDLGTGWLFFDVESAGAPGSTIYKLKLTSNYPGTQPPVRARGNSGAYAQITASRAGAAQIVDDGANPSGLLDLDFCKLTNLGSVSASAISTRPSSDGSDALASLFSITNSIFTTCGDVTVAVNLGPYAKFTVKNCSFKSSVGTYNLNLQSFNAGLSAYVRLIDGNVFDLGPFFQAPVNVTIQNNYFHKRWTVTDGNWTLFQNNFCRKDDVTEWVAAGSTQNNYWVVDGLFINPHYVQTGSYARSFTHDGEIFEFTGNDGQGDCFLLGTPGSGPFAITIKNSIVLPNAAGDDSGTLITALGNSNLNFSCTHNTFFSGTQGAAIAETYAGYAGMCTAFKSNIAWDTSGRSYKLYRSGTTMAQDYVTAANVDYNCGLNVLVGSNGKGYNNLNFSSGSPGAHDIDLDPQFVDKTRDLAKWDSSLGGPGTVASALTNLQKKNDAAGYNAAYSIPNLIAYIRGGFAPKAQALKAAGHDGLDIGAVSVVAAGGAGAGFPTALPMKAQWEANMLEFPAYNSQFLGDALQQRTAAGTNEAGQNNYYYDAMRVFYQIKAYTGDAATWNAAATNSRAAFRDYYVIPNNGATHGIWPFMEGLVLDWEQQGNTTSKSAAILILQNSVFMNSSAFNDQFQIDQVASRETAYALEAHLLAPRVGLTLNTVRIEQLLNFALGHVDQWAVSKTAGYLRPFMASLTSEALIKYVTVMNPTGTKLATILNAVKTLWGFIWDTMWVSSASAFMYTNKIVDDPHDMDPAPNLNLLCLHSFGWLYYQTGDTTWITKGDQVFQGGVSVYSGQNWVSGAYLGQRTAFGSSTDHSVPGVNGKLVDQNYRTSFDYVKYRELNPLTTPGGGTTPPDPTGGPGGDGAPPDNTPPPTPQPTRALARGSFTYREDGSIVILAENNKDIFLGTTGQGAIKLMVNGVVVQTILSGSSQSGDLSVQNGDIAALTIGKGLKIKGGPNARAGVATLVGGTIIVANTTITANTQVLLTVQSPGGTPGKLSVSKLVGTSFTIASDNAADISTVFWMLVEVT